MTYVARIQSVLAETYSELKVNGFSTWEEFEFYDDARKVVQYFYGVSMMGDAVGVASRQDVLNDFLDPRYGVDWSIPSEYTLQCAEACLDELYDELLGDERWSSGV